MRLRTSTLAVAPMLLIAACGGTAAPLAAQPDARQVVLASVQKSSGTSFLADMTVNVTLSATGPSASTFGALAGKPIAITMHMSAESQRRARLTIHEALGTTQADAVAVRYDGTTYISSNGGSTFKVLPGSGTNQDKFAQEDALSYLQSVAAVTDEGAGTADGVAIERYSAQLDGAKVIELIKAGLSAGQATAALKVFDSMTFTRGTLHVAIDQRGRVVSVSGPVDASVDLAAFGASFAGTRMDIHEVLDGHFHDYGSPVTVTRPAVTATS